MCQNDFDTFFQARIPRISRFQFTRTVKFAESVPEILSLCKLLYAFDISSLMGKV